MWLHKIVDDLKNTHHPIKVNTYYDVDYIVNELLKCTTFYLGNIDGITNTMEKIFKKAKQPWFLNGPSVNYLPYKNCCFEYEDTITLEHLQKNYPQLPPDMIKNMWLDTKIKNEKLTLWVRDVGNNTIAIRSFVYNYESDHWYIYPNTIYVKIGDTFQTRDKSELINKYGLQIQFDYAGNCALVWDNNEFANDTRTITPTETAASYDVPRLGVFLMALNSKSIYTETILPSEKINKKRIRSGKTPQYSYEVLNIKTPLINRANRTLILSDALNHNRLHFCRGHFKYYTEDHRLFGKYTGIYWWEEFIRGQNKDGFVDKDYWIKKAA